jgi:hypothetical protein
MVMRLSVLALSLGCSVFTGPADFPHAVATFACGPADGPATGITLASLPIPPAGPTFPYVAIMIDQPLSALAGRTFLVGSGGTAGASYNGAPNSFESASMGRVIIASVDADSTIHGEVSLTFPSRQVVVAFTAPWIHRTGVLCG